MLHMAVHIHCAWSMQVAVGVGALAGSTIMLLTIPWFLSIVGGRVDIVDGRANYRKPKKGKL